MNTQIAVINSVFHTKFTFYKFNYPPPKPKTSANVTDEVVESALSKLEKDVGFQMDHGELILGSLIKEFQ